jgi:hypothetical protein
MYKYPCHCFNKSVFNWTFCQLPLCLKKNQIAQSNIYFYIKSFVVQSWQKLDHFRKEISLHLLNKTRQLFLTCDEFRIFSEPDDVGLRLGLVDDTLQLHHLVLLDLQPGPSWGSVLSNFYIRHWRYGRVS